MRKETKAVKFLRFMKAYNEKETSVLLWHPIGILMFVAWVLVFIITPPLALLNSIPHFVKLFINETYEGYGGLVPMKRLFTFKYKGGSNAHS